MTTINANGFTATSTPATAQNAALPKDVNAWLASGQCVLIDVREPDEHARERIAGAALIPLSRFDPQQAFALARPGQKIVLHCRTGRRSADACRMAWTLAKSGFTVVNMAGGIEAWKKDALPVVTDTRVARISVMRQVQLVIGVAVLTGAALAWLVDPRFIAIPAFFGAGLTFAGASGTCALAGLLARMPWNRAASAGASCSTGSCA